MILKASQRGGGANLAAHLTRDVFDPDRFKKDRLHGVLVHMRRIIAIFSAFFADIRVAIPRILGYNTCKRCGE